MPRLSPGGKRLTVRPVRYPVPRQLLGRLDVQAAEVIRHRRDLDYHDSQARRLAHQAYQAGAAADRAADRGLRQMLFDQSERLRLQAAGARSRAVRARNTLGQSESALAALHHEARSWRRGDHQDDE